MPARNPERETALGNILDAYANERDRANQARKERNVKPSEAAMWILRAQRDAISAILNATRAPSGRKKRNPRGENTKP